MCQVVGVVEECGAPAPGLTEIYLADAADVATIPVVNTTPGDAAEGTIATAITMVASKTFKKVEFSQFSGQIMDELKDAMSSGYSKGLKFTLKKYAPKTNSFLTNIVGAKVIAICVDNNGQMILMGDKSRPLRVKSGKGSTGAKDTDLSGWEIELSGISNVPCAFYTGALPATGP